MDTKKLRQKILDLAIHGKLVPQDPNDEPASVLLERIRAEKERLVKEGKIKKSKASKTSDTPHYENVPFEVPSSWEWTTLGAISNYGENKNVQIENIEAEEWILELEDIEKDSAKIIQYLSKNERKINGTRHKFCKGEILYSKLRTYLNKVLIAPNNGYCTTEITPFVTFGLSNEYVCHVLRSPYFLDYTQQCGYGVKMPRLSTTDACNGMIPLPPLAEQYRIISEIEKWFAFIDIIESDKTDLQTTIKQTKCKILDLAIHGKLVPQNPSDEPALELLKRINPKAEITCDNGHYQNLPKGWCTTSIKNICDNINGLWKGKKEPFINVGVIRNANFTKDFKLDYSNIEYIDVEQRAFSQRHLKNGDLIIEKSGGSDNYPVGRAILYEGKDELYSFSNFTMVLRIKDKNIISSKFLYYYLLDKYKKGVMRTMQTQTTGLHNLILDKYLSMELYIPPYSEQKRIIDAIEELFANLDAIMESL